MLLLCGTRPEAIKLAPVYRAISTVGGPVSPILCSSGQHTELVRRALETFDLKPGRRLDLGTRSMSLIDLQAALMSALGPLLDDLNPDLMVVQGDTATALVGAQAAFSAGVPVAHVEAGLRSFDLRNPFPEEGCRAMIAQVASMHFSPTRRSADNLRRAGIPAERVLVTGNTVTDAALEISKHRPAWPAGVPKVPTGLDLIVVTTHRRESWGSDLAAICRAISTLHLRFTNVIFMLPVHPNPDVRTPVNTLLRGHERIWLIDPLPYDEFMTVLRHAKIALTDSGGIQEEAPTFGVPTLVMRKVTERPEALEAGVAKLVGTDHDSIVYETERLLTDSVTFERMAKPANPFGDGRAACRIALAINRYLSGRTPLLSEREQFVPTPGNLADEIE